MSLTRVALAMTCAAVFAVLLAPRPGPYVLEPVPAGDGKAIATCHAGEVLSMHGGHFTMCQVPQ